MKPMLDIRILGAPDIVDDLRGELALRAPGVEVVESGPVADATDLAFDLGQVAELVAVAKDALPLLTALVPLLHGIFQRRTSPSRIVVESPLGRVTLDVSPDMTEEEIRAALRRLVEV
jgi:hypothetical protein